MLKTFGWVVLVQVCFLASAWASFDCVTDQSNPIRRDHEVSVRGDLDSAGHPASVQVLRSLDKTLLAFVEVAVPADFYPSDPARSSYDRFDVTGAQTGDEFGNTYYLDLPKPQPTSPTFHALLDVYYGGGHLGWYRYELSCTRD